MNSLHFVIFGLFLLALLLRGYALSAQPPTDDEVGAASAASNYMNIGLFGQVMWYHPPLRNIVVFLGGKLWGGYTAWGLRFGSVIFGSLTVPALGYLGYSLFKSKRIAYLAAFFLCIDPLHISLSREAFQETTTAFFIVSGVLVAYHGIVKDCLRSCLIAGALFGIASSSKWHGLFPWAVSAVTYVGAPWLIKDYIGDHSFVRRLFIAFAAFVAIPLVCYITSYLPWIYRGYSMAEFLDMQVWLVKHQYYYKGTPYTEDFLPHRAYQWFLWPVPWIDFVYHQGKSYLNIAIGNFLVWVMTLPALYYSLKAWFRERDFGIGLVISIFLVSYLPLILTTRSVWVFAAPAVIPFAFLMIAFAMSDLIENSRLSKRMIMYYFVLVILLSALLYPLATFRALDVPWAKFLAETYSPHKK